MIEELNRLLADAATDPALRNRLHAGELRAVLTEYDLQETRLTKLTGSQSLQSIAQAATNLIQELEAAEPTAPPSASEGLRLLAQPAFGPADEMITDQAWPMPSPARERHKQPAPRSVTAASRP